MKLPGFLTPLGILAGALTLLLLAGLIVTGSWQIFSPGPLSAANPTGAVLGGVSSHAALGANCAACHTAPWSNQNMAERCRACHTQIATQLADPNSLHGMLQANNCRDCHSEHGGPQASLTQVKTLVVNHEKFTFSLARHQTAADQQPFRCADCHTESLTRFDPARCESCHRSYQADFVSTHVRDYGANCRACHDGTDTFSKDTFDHNRTAYPLTGQHAAAPCSACHPQVTGLAGFKQAPVNCEGCHQKDNKHPANFGTDCARCHNTAGWQTEIFDHNLSSYKLTGKHLDVTCQQCHVNNVYRGTPQTCVACHVQDDPHSIMLGTNCETCHTTQDWKQTTFDHNKNTSYRLTGKHAQAACTACHANNIYRGTSQTCISCHAKDDTHRGTFGADCAACHDTNAWKPPTFQHIFPLDHGGKGIIACTTCHTVPNNYRAYTCYSCHKPADIQRLHFFVRLVGNDIANCVRCHPTGRRTTQMH